MENNHANMTPSVLTQVAFLEILQHQAMLDILNRVARKRTWAQRLNGLLFMLAALLSVGGFYLGWSVNAADTKKAEYRDYVQRQNVDVDNIIAKKRDWMHRGGVAMLNLLMTRTEILLHCRAQQPLSLAEQAKLRSDARFAMYRAFVGTRLVFNEAVHRGYVDFLAFDDSVPDVCAKSAPADDVWITKAEALGMLMEQSLVEEEAELRQI